MAPHSAGKIATPSKTWTSKCLRITALAVGAMVCAGEVAAQSPFFLPPSFPGGGQTVAADFNGDGKPDLVSSDGTVLIGQGDGTFTTAAVLPVSGDSIAAGDFNGDGKSDVIVTSNSSTVMSVLLGNGDGTFHAALTVNVGAALKSLVVADFNGDGKLDIAGVNDTSGLLVLLGVGNGSFSAASGSPIALAPGSLIVAGDFNGDGKTDIAYASSSNSSAGVPGGVLVGKGDGTFKSGSALTIGLENVTAVGAADLNGSGKLDLVFSGSTSGTGQTVTLLGNGDGTFQAVGSVLAAGGAMGITDLNRDHKSDLVIDDGIVVRVFLGNGDGTFVLQNTYWQASGAGTNASVLAADFNGNGTMDVASRNLMLLGNGDGSLQGNDTVVPGQFVDAGVIADFNGDGSPDVITAYGSNVIVLLNDGTGKFIQAHSYASPGGPFAYGDLNHDGKLDVLLATSDPNNQTFALSVMFGNGDGTFGTPASTGISGVSSLGANLIDLNGDQIPDFVFLTSQGVNVLLGKGDGTFSTAVNYFAGSSPITFQIGDFNGDGKADVVVAGATNIGTLFGKGDGTFAPVVLSNPGLGGSFAVGDANGDGKLDLITPAASGVAVYLGNGDGTFQASLDSTTFGPIDGYSTVAVADVNGDGKLDAIGGPGLWFIPGNGDGTFGTAIGVLLGHRVFGPLVQAIVDLNGDGRPDALITTVAGFQPEMGFATLLNTSGTSLPNFTLVATQAAPGNIEAGSIATSTVTVTPSNGFATNVALSCVGLPTGSSCTFAPTSSVGGTFTSTLTIGIGSAVGSGTYYIAVVGAGAGITHSRLLTLNVAVSAPDFSVSAESGGTATVAAGNSATYSLSVGGSGGFVGTVALSCSGTPTGATCTVSPTSVMVSGSTAATATVTITTTARSETMPPRVGRYDRWPSIHQAPRLVVLCTAVFAVLTGLLLIFGSEQRRRASLAPVAAGVLLLAGMSISGCAGSSAGTGSTPGGGGATGTPAGSYAITLTATAGSGANVVTHTAKLTLIVQ